MAGVPLPVLLVTGVPIVDIGMLEKACGGEEEDLFMYEGTGCGECQHIADTVPGLVQRRESRPKTCAVILTTEVVPTSYLTEVLNMAHKMHFRVEQHQTGLSVAGLANHLVCEYLDPSFPYTPGAQFITTLRRLCKTRSIPVLLHFLEKCINTTNMSDLELVLRSCTQADEVALEPKGDFAKRRARVLSVLAEAVEYQDRHGTDRERETLAEVCADMWYAYSKGVRITDNHVDMFLQACGRQLTKEEGAEVRRVLHALNGADPMFQLQAEDGAPLPKNIWVTPPIPLKNRTPCDYMNDVLWCLRKAKEPVPATALVKRVEKLAASFTDLSERGKKKKEEQRLAEASTAQINRAIHDLVAFDILDLMEGGYIPSVQIAVRNDKVPAGHSNAAKMGKGQPYTKGAAAATEAAQAVGTESVVKSQASDDSGAHPHHLPVRVGSLTKSGPVSKRVQSLAGRQSSKQEILTHLERKSNPRWTKGTGMGGDARESQWGVALGKSKVEQAAEVVEGDDEELGCEEVGGVVQEADHLSSDDSDDDDSDDDDNEEDVGGRDENQLVISQSSTSSLQQQEVSNTDDDDDDDDDDSGDNEGGDEAKEEEGTKSSMEQSSESEESSGQKRKRPAMDMDSSEEGLPRKAGSRGSTSNSMPTTAAKGSPPPASKKRRVSKKEPAEDSSFASASASLSVTTFSDFSSITKITGTPVGDYTNPKLKQNNLDSDLLHASLHLISSRLNLSSSLSDGLDLTPTGLAELAKARKLGKKHYYKWFDWEHSEGGWCLTSMAMDQIRDEVTKSYRHDAETLARLQRAMNTVKELGCSGVLIHSQKDAKALDSIGWVEDCSLSEMHGIIAPDVYRRIRQAVVTYSGTDFLYYEATKRDGDLKTFAKDHFGLHNFGKHNTEVLRAKMKEYIPFPKWVRDDPGGSLIIEAFRRHVHNHCLSARVGHVLLDNLFLSKAVEGTKSPLDLIPDPRNKAILRNIRWATKPEKAPPSGDAASDMGDQGSSSSSAHDKTEEADFNECYH
eukprot:TRINITY_DN8762_c0_g1_i1.p1 TRINITY_DN8762_c0_g1~~TRINITY_DN8762_c0_g1_i1.p1  ORF type:complete len:1091 (+),score=287.24 TRINITY_DN8762_c0_g1_i1:220-3273(+)